MHPESGDWNGPSNAGTPEADYPTATIRVKETINKRRYLQESSDQAKDLAQGNEPEIGSSSANQDDGPACLLKCKNGGTCSKPGDPRGAWGHYMGTYCHCRDGFAGIECEFEAEICGMDELVCLHGTRCTPTSISNGADSGGYECLCPPQRENCNKREIDYCSLTGDLNVFQGNETVQIPTFCVNGGTCRRKHDKTAKK